SSSLSRDPPKSPLFPYTTLFRSRANVAEARVRLLRVFPNAPRIPTLRQIQHALAQERGFSGWAELKQRLPAEASLTRRYERVARSEEHTSELQSRGHLVCRLLLE